MFAEKRSAFSATYLFEPRSRTANIRNQEEKRILVQPNRDRRKDLLFFSSLPGIGESPLVVSALWLFHQAGQMIDMVYRIYRVRDIGCGP